MATQQVNIPDIGGAEDVEVIEVLVSAGDEVEKDQSLIVLESDKASMEIPSEIAGTVKEVLVSLGDKVSEGGPMLIMEVAGGAAGEAVPPAQEASPAAEPEAVSAPAAEAPVAKRSSGPQETVTETIRVPDIGGSEGVLVIEICVRAGDEIQAEDPLIVLESDKASMEVPSPKSGRVGAIHVNLDDQVSEGSPILDLELATASAPSVSEAPEPAAHPASTAPKAAFVPVEVSGSEETLPPEFDHEVLAQKLGDLPLSDRPVDSATAVHAGPAVRRLAREFGVDLSRVPGSARNGRIIKEDVQAFVRDALSGAASGPDAGGAGLPPMPEVDFSKFGEVEVTDLSKINKLSASNLHRSWLHVPHVTQFDEADITELEAFRKSHNAGIGPDGVKLTLLPFILKACAVALRAYPRFNSSLHPSGEQLILKKYCNIGIAVDTPNGLVVPVVRNADGKGIQALSSDCGELAEKARTKRLRTDDMQGGCFSISSLGGIGGSAFTPIVNAPEVAILGLSRSNMKPVYQDGDFVPRLMLPLCLSYDHRVIDGAAAARFTSLLADLLGDIRKLLL